MIKVEVIEDFTLQKFDELKNVQRKAKEVKGKLFVGDTFECSEDMVKYLTGDNPLGKAVVAVIEYEPKKQKEIDEENVVPLAPDNLEKIKEDLEEHIEIPKKAKKKKSKN